MRRTGDLVRLNNIAAKRLARIGYLLNSHKAMGLERNVIIGWCAIELDNLIIGMHREFLISCFVGCKTSTGQPVSHSAGPMTEQSAVRFITSILEPGKFKRYTHSPIPRRDEPNLRDPSKVIQVANSANFSNIASIVAASSLSLNVFSEIKLARHFFAHRNRDTAADLYRLGSSRSLMRPAHAWMVVDQLLPLRPYSILDEWMGEVGQFHPMLTQ